MTTDQRNQSEPEIKPKQRGNRRADILEAVATMLETAPGAKITTAKLATAVGVSEAAIYRHFASKAQIFEGLIGFAEDAIFSRIQAISASQQTKLDKTRDVLLLVLTFFERNPGIARLMMGDPLVGEAPRLKPRVRQLFDRVETECRQLIRDEQLESMANAILTPSEQTTLFMHMLEGAIARFVRSEFNALPTEHFAAYWPVLASGMRPTAH